MKSGTWRAAGFAALVCVSAFPARPGGVVTYSSIPAMDAVICRYTAPITPGEFITLCLESAGGNAPVDEDTKLVDGLNAGRVTDDIVRVKWSVSVGNVEPAETTYPALGFMARWTIPVGTPPGRYVATAKVYDAGRYGSGSRDSSEPYPVTRTVTVEVGPRVYVADPPIQAHIVASATELSPGQQITLSATDDTLSAPPKDFDREYLGGVLVETIPDTMRRIEWNVTDLAGESRGTLADDAAATTTWTAPSVAGTYYATLTVDDTGMGRNEKDEQAYVTQAVTVGPVTAYQRQMTEATVAQRARSFCADIGAAVPMDTPARVRFPAVRGGEISAYNYRPKWEVTFGSEVAMNIVDTDGSVARFSDVRARSGSPNSKEPAGPGITEEAANAVAANVLVKSAILEELLANAPVLDSLEDEPLSGWRAWHFAWDRRFQGIGYWQQGLGLSIQADTGRVQAFTARFECPAPASNIEAVSSATAEQTATVRLVARGVTGLTHQSTTKAVVRPNAVWEPEAAEEPLPVPPRVAWDVTYTGGNRVCEVWIDTETGDVLGGVGYEYGGFQRPPAPKPQVIKPAAPAPKGPLPKVTEPPGAATRKPPAAVRKANAPASKKPASPAKPPSKPAKRTGGKG